MPERVVLAMSGGVDSSAAAYLLKKQGYDVIGLFMRSGATDETCTVDESNPLSLPVINVKSHKQGCCSASDAADARRVADELDIPFHALNFQDAFGRIKDYFADEYLAGRTPNPCVMCNNWLKFGRLWDFARQVGATKIASGHYAQLETDPSGTTHLLRGLDLSKDQSYVLFGIHPDLLPRILFPVGGYQKSEIRELAGAARLETANKRDSQEICFIPDNDYAGFVNRYRGEQQTAGNFVTQSGEVLGKHIGFEHFTIGQRRGLGIAFGSPKFVLEIRPESCDVVLGDYEELGRNALIADRTNWLAEVPRQFRCQAQIRYQHRPADCEVTCRDDGTIEARFENPQFGVAPGQAFVCYDENRVLGGGWIRESLNYSITQNQNESVAR
ncbi:MAG TPA: tRNA 2-thiouridine(34) synthase MnmA [Planctomycetaceae bacterium]|nr:tRNA 2-thiouridine(34) synthase MnmA [Planctomycetaceae bacterium]